MHPTVHLPIRILSPLVSRASRLSMESTGPATFLRRPAAQTAGGRSAAPRCAVHAALRWACHAALCLGLALLWAAAAWCILRTSLWVLLPAPAAGSLLCKTCAGAARHRRRLAVPRTAASCWPDVSFCCPACCSDLAEATRRRLEEAAARKEAEEREKAAQRYQRKEYRTGKLTGAPCLAAVWLAGSDGRCAGGGAALAANRRCSAVLPLPRTRLATGDASAMCKCLAEEGRRRFPAEMPGPGAVSALPLASLEPSSRDTFFCLHIATQRRRSGGGWLRWRGLRRSTKRIVRHACAGRRRRRRKKVGGFVCA